MTDPSAFLPEVDTRSDQTREGVRMLAELVLSDSLYGQFLRSTLAASPPGQQTEMARMLQHTDERKPSQEQWTYGFNEALKKRVLRDLLKETMAAGFHSLWSTTAQEAAKGFDHLNANAFRASRTYLLGTREMSSWVALAGVCVVRAAQANAGLHWRSDNWGDMAFATFSLEEGLRLANGTSISSSLNEYSKCLSQPFARLVGERLPHGLSEIITNVPDASFVRRLVR